MHISQRKRLSYLNIMMFRAILLSWTLLLVIGCKKDLPFFEDATCFTNISVIDPEHGLASDQTVIIKNNKIIKVVDSNSLDLSPKNNMVDGTGQYMMPGLWDAHVHFAFMEELAPSMFDLFLAYGITSVRDTGGKIDFVKSYKDKSLQNPETSPRVMIAGPLLDGMPNVYDGSDASRPPLSVGSSNIEELTKNIKDLIEKDVDLLKAYEMLTPEQFAVLNQLAQENGLKVTGHVPLSMDVITASNLGMKSMEHMRNIELSCASNSTELLEQRKNLLYDGRNDQGGILRSRIHSAQRANAIENYSEKKADEVLDALYKNQTWQIPTLALSTGFTKRPFAKAEFQESFKYLPSSVEENWKNRITQTIKQSPTEFHHQYTDWMFKMVKKINDKGIGIMAGTDCPIFYLTPGRSLHEELSVLVKAGLSPLEAIESATIRPAEYFGIEKELGNVREGMLADLLILDANPIDDINNTLKINSVIRNGNLINRAALDKLLNDLDTK